MGLFERLFGSKKSNKQVENKKEVKQTNTEQLQSSPQNVEVKQTISSPRQTQKPQVKTPPKRENKLKSSRLTLKQFVDKQLKAKGIKTQMIEEDYLKPALAEILANDHQKNNYDFNPKAFEEKYFFLFAISNLVYHFPEDELIETILDYLLNGDDSIPGVRDLIRHNGRYQLADHPERRDIVNTGTAILKIYHGLYIKKDQNFSRAYDAHSTINQARKSHNENDFFKLLSVATREISYETPWILLHAVVYKEYDFKSKETIVYADKKDMVSSMIHDIMDAYNSTFNMNLSSADIVLIGEHMAYVDKCDTYTKSNYKDRKKLGLKDLPELTDFLETAKSSMPTFMSAWMYYGSFYLSPDTSKIIKEVTTALLSKYDSNGHEFENWLTVKEYISKESNKSFYAPLFDAYVKAGNYTDYTTNAFEIFYYKFYGVNESKTIPKKITAGLTTISEMNPNQYEKEIKKVVYKSPISVTELNADSFGFYTASTKTREEGVLALHAQFNSYIPSSIKSVNKGQYYQPDSELFVVNIDGQDHDIPYSLTKPLNNILQEKQTGVRFVPVPIAHAIDYYGRDRYINTLSLLNLKQFKYLTEQYIPSKFPELKNMLAYTSIEFINTEGEALHEAKEGDIFENEGVLFSGGFANDVKWAWFKEAYIDKLKSKEKWYKAMDVLTEFSGTKKPSKQWVSDMNQVIKEMGEKLYFDELASLIYESKEEKSWFFDEYNKTMKGMIWSCTLRSTEQALLIIKTVTELSYVKVPGVGPRSTKTGNFCMEALATSPSEIAYGILQLMRLKSKYPRFVRAIDKFIEKYKENNQGNIEELEDKALPDFGIKNGVKIYEFVDAQLELSFLKGKVAKTYIVDGKRQKKIPDLLKTKHAARLKEVTAEIKQINDIIKSLQARLKSFWLFNRTWKFGDWHEYIYKHPLMNPLIENMVWIGVDSEELFLSQADQLVQTNGAVISLDDQEEVRLWHPIMADEDELEELKSYFNKNKIKQIEKQVGREFYNFTKKDLENDESKRFSNESVEVRKLMALANSAGWTFTYVHEDVSWPRVYLKEIDMTAHFKCDYDRNAAYIPTAEFFISKGDTSKISYNTVFEKIKLSDVPGTTLSEICRDIDMFVSVANQKNESS